MYPGRTLGSAHALVPQYSPLKLNYDVGESCEITVSLFNNAMKGPEKILFRMSRGRRSNNPESRASRREHC